MGLSVYHSRTATGADNALYDVQLQRDWNGSHLFTLNAVGSEVSGAFGNGGGVSFGLSADGKVTAAAPAGAPSPINFSAGTTSSNIGSVVFSDSNGVGWGLNGSTITASYTQSTHSHSSLFFADSNGLNWGTNASSVTGSYTQSTHAHTAWPVAFSAGTQTATSGTPGLANSNNFTFGMSGSSQITASFSESTHAHTAWPLGFSAGTQTATSGTPGLANSNNFTFGMSGSSQITASFSESTHSHSSLSFSNLNGVTFGIAGSTLTASVAAGAGGVAAGISNTGNTAGNTGTVSSGTLVFAASGGITASESTAAGQSTLWFSVAAPVAQTNQTVGLYALGNTTQNSSTTLDARTMSFNGLGAATWGYSNGSIQVSVPATSSLVGTSGLSVSTNGSTISVFPKAVFSYEVYPIQDASAVLSANNGSSGAASFFPFIINEPVAAGMLLMAMNMSFTTNGTSSGRQSQTFSYGLYTQGTGANSSTMGTITSASFSLGVTGNNSSYTFNQPTSSNSAGYTTQTTNSSGVNISSGYTGGKLVQFPVNSTLTPGNYWLGLFVANSTSSVNVGLSESFIGAGISSTAINMAPIGSFSTDYSSGTNVMRRIGNIRLGHGSFTSAAQTNLPVSVAFSAISHNLTVMPYIYFWSTV